MSVYKSSTHKLLSYFLIAAFVSILVLTILFAIVTNDGLNDEELLPMFLVIALIVGIGNALFHYITISVDEEEIKFTRFNRVYRTISMSEPSISSYIVNHYVNGIPAGKSLYVRVFHSNNKQKDYRCSGFSKKQFQNLIGQIYVLRNGEQVVSEPVTPPTDTEELLKVIYDIPKDELLVKEYRRQTKLWIVFTVIAAVIVIGLYIFLSSSGLDLFSSEMFAPFLMMVGLILLMCIGIPFFTFRKQLNAISKDIPSRLMVNDTTITIDDDYFQVNQIENIKVTPPKYGNNMNNQKRLIRFHHQGRTYVYFFGYVNPTLPYYENYEDLCIHLEEIFRKQNQFIYEI